MALDASLAAAVARMKDNPVEVTLGSLEIPCESADITFSTEVIKVAHPVVGAYEAYVSSGEIRVALTVPEESVDLFTLLNPDGYDHTATAIGFGNIAGTSLRSSAQQLTIRPYNLRAVETTKLVIWKAYVDGDIQKIMGKEGSAFVITFASLADADKADGDLHGRLTLPARS